MKQGRGFSLLEVMVSGALFLVAVTGVVSTVSTSASLRSDMRLHAAAAEIAQERMERLLTAARGAPELSPTAIHEERRGNSGALDAAGAFIVSWTVSTLVAVPAVSHVVVDVRWRTGGRSKNLTLETNRD